MTDKSGLLDHGKSVRPPHYELHGWWWKLWIFSWEFRTSIGYRPILWLDLDTVVLDSLDFLINGSEFLILRDIYRKDRWGSGIMYIPPRFGQNIWETFVKRPHKYMQEYARCGDQHFIQTHGGLGGGLIQERHPGKVVSYKADIRDNGGKVPKGAHVVVFHGRPRPHEVADKHRWMKKHWG